MPRATYALRHLLFGTSERADEFSSDMLKSNFATMITIDFLVLESLMVVFKFQRFYVNLCVITF